MTVDGWITTGGEVFEAYAEQLGATLIYLPLTRQTSIHRAVLVEAEGNGSKVGSQEPATAWTRRIANGLTAISANDCAGWFGHCVTRRRSDVPDYPHN